MRLPKETTLRADPVVLSADEVRFLNEQLATMCHDVNNKMAGLVAVLDLIRLQPHSVEKRLAHFDGQLARIGEYIRAFSNLFEEMLGINRPPRPPA